MDKKLYIGGLGEDMQREDIEDGFAKFGEIEHVWIARKPAGFAFVTYKAGEAAEEAVREMNGATFKGQTLKVEISKSDGKRKPPRRETYGGSRDTAAYERPRYEDDSYRRDTHRDDYGRRGADYDDHYKRDYAPPARYDDRDYRRDDYSRRDEPMPQRHADYPPRRSPVPSHQYQRRSRSYDRRGRY